MEVQMHTQNITRHMIKTSLCIQIVGLSIALYSWKAPRGLSKLLLVEHVFGLRLLDCINNLLLFYENMLGEIDSTIMIYTYSDIQSQFLFL